MSQGLPDPAGPSAGGARSDGGIGVLASHSPGLEALFRRVIAWRWPIVAFYALLLVPSVYFALRVDQDNQLDRLIVQMADAPILVLLTARPEFVPTWEHAAEVDVLDLEERLADKG